ncbi:MAG: hypothetical protein ABSG76_03230 [Xanthobacteraceae bacterium]
MADTATDLVRFCVAARRAGADFPTIWHTLLKGHPLVAGIPIQSLDGARSILEIPLITGHRITYEPDLREFGLSAGGGGMSRI